MTTTRPAGPREPGPASPQAVLWLLPVVDPDNRLLGVITVDDALDAAIPDSWRHRGPDTALLHHAGTPTTPRPADEPEE